MTIFVIFKYKLNVGSFWADIKAQSIDIKYSITRKSWKSMKDFLKEGKILTTFNSMYLFIILYTYLFIEFYVF